ncbi:RHS repeat-associated core domain-containing protein [Streptomyces sp. NPDC091292]|uniref:RHS repeat-associated core domain-containing protein n=1 Tax=Streptomyces sp. NPDC091292 TaxID=3365991 RepID=UPI00380EBB5C
MLLVSATGNTTTRPGVKAAQTLKWNSEGKLASTTEATATTDYLYDANGELLIRRAKGDGDTILYLGGQEVRLTTKGTTKTLSGTRYYVANGQTVAVRTATVGTTGTKLAFLAADHHGTSSLVLDATTYAITKRYTTPFGAPRGTKPTTWPDDKSFLGKPVDATTGLTHVGAREYDPGIGQFISVDPILTLDQHQSLNGYSYANNTPVTSSDPTGLQMPADQGPHDPPTNTLPGSDNCYTGNLSASCGGISGGGSTGSGTGTAPAGSDGYVQQSDESGGCGFWDVRCGWNQLWKTDCGFWDVRCGVKENAQAWKNAVVALSPIEDGKKCVSEHELSSCGWLMAGFLPLGKLKALAKALDKGEDAAKAAQIAGRGITLTGKVKYGEGHLSQAVQLQRLIAKDKNGNYASALLKDGTVIVARSGGGPHAEEKLLDAAGDRIVAVYSERQPCNGSHNCAKKLSDAGIGNISWSFDWSSDKAVQRKATSDLADAVNKLFNR